MIPNIDQHGKLLYEQIYEFYKDAILGKRLDFNKKLPSYRLLAKELGVSNNTVLKAYEQLILEGYVKNVNRQGLFVAKFDSKEWQLNTGPKKTSTPGAAITKKKRAGIRTSDHLVDEKNFPVRQWRKCSNWA